MIIKFLNNVSVKLGIVFGCGIICGCIVYYCVALPFAERGIFAIPFVLFPFCLMYMAMKITWELFE